MGFGLGSQSNLDFWTSRDFASLGVGLEIRASVGLWIESTLDLVQIGLWTGAPAGIFRT